MNVEVKAAALFNIFNANITGRAEGDDTSGPFQFPGDTPTNNLLSEEQNLTISAAWQAGGIIPALTDLDYTLTVYLDSKAIASTTVNATPIAPAAASNYAASVVLPKGQDVGVHDLSVTLNVRQHDGPQMHLPVAGHQRLGTLHVFPA